MFPTADQIAIAVVTACRLFGEDPFAVCRGEFGVRARHVTLDALLEVFPEARRTGLVKCLGYSDTVSAKGQLRAARKGKWWSEIAVDEVIGVLVANHYGEQAQ